MIDCTGPVDGVCITRGWGVLHDPRICEWCRTGSISSAGKIELKSSPCIHMVDTEEAVPDRPCKGNYIVCGNEKCPAFGVSRIHSSCGCRPTKCKYYEASATKKHCVGVIIPARNECDIYQTVESHKLAGADYIIVVDDASVCAVRPIDGARVIRNDTAQGPAACRNRWRELPPECDMVGFSDAHVRVPLDAWAELAASAHAAAGIATACSCSMCGTTVYRGGEIRHDDGLIFSCPGVNRQRENPALYGSVYAAPRVILEHIGGWPLTVSWGYNEQALTLAARGAGVPIVVCGVVAKHEYRKKFPYPVRNSNVEINRVITHWMLSTDDEWSAWQEHFLKKYPAAMDAFREHAKSRESWRNHYLSIRKHNPFIAAGGKMPTRTEYRLATLGGYGDVLMLSAIAAGIKRHIPGAVTTLCTKRRDAWDVVGGGSFDKISRYCGETLLRYPDAGRRIKPTMHLVRHMWADARKYWPELPEEIGDIHPHVCREILDIIPSRGIGIISHFDQGRKFANKKAYPHAEKLCLLLNARGIDAELIGKIDGSIFEVAKRIAEYETLIVTEGFLHHLAAGLGRKCFVITGPTPANTHIYDGQIAIETDTPCGICFDTRPCRMPESCMQSLAPETIVERVCNVGAQWAKSNG